MRKRILVYAIIVLVIPILSSAAPFIRAHTGLINSPTPDVVQHLAIEVAGSAIYYRGLVGTVDAGKSQYDWDARLTVGLLDRIEIGVAVLTSKLYAGSIKLKFLDEGEYVPSMAWGIKDINTRGDITSTGNDSIYENDQNNSLYIVMAKHFELGIKFDMHLGIGTNGFKADTPSLKQLGGLFGGLKIPMPIDEVKDLSLLMELDGKHVNAGLEYAFPFGVKLGIVAQGLERLRYASEERDGAEGLTFGGGLIINTRGLGLW
jgi:hypothetical protein